MAAPLQDSESFEVHRMIDALIVTHNLAKDLPFCLTSLMGWTGRVFVIDVGSDDGTAEVARRYGAHVTRRELREAEAEPTGLWALNDLAWQSPWVLVLEADEIVTPALRDLLQRTAAANAGAGYTLARAVYVNDRVSRDNGRVPALRLFQRARVVGDAGAPAGSIAVDGPVTRLSLPLLHCPNRKPGHPPHPRPPGAQREAPPGSFAEKFGHLATPGQRVVVTGGSGFIGSNIVEFYHQAGAEVVNLDHGPPRNERYRDLWRGIDLLDREGLARAVRDFEPELFFHLAARTDLREKHDPAGYAANITGVENVLAALGGVKSLKRVIITSTQLVCPLVYRPTHDKDYRPDTVYGQSKVATEVLTRTWERAPCPWALVRPTSIWGPGFDEPYRGFFIAVARGRYVHGGAMNPTRTFGYVGNVVYQYVSLTRAPEGQVAGRTFYLSDFEPVRVRDWAEMISREMGIRPPRQVPLPVLRVAAKVGDVAGGLGWKSPPLTSFRLRNMLSNSVADTAPLRAAIGELPYKLEEGVRATVKWLRDAGLIDVPGRRESEPIVTAGQSPEGG